MPDREEIVKVIADLIKHGINLDNKSIYHCNMFMKELYEFINTRTHLNAHYTGSKISIESIFFEPMLSVELDKTTVQCIPVNDEGWIDAVFEVIKFLHIKGVEEKEKKAQQQKKEKESNKEFDWL